MDNIKQYENKNKKSKCLTRELTIDEKEKYNIGENKMNKELKIDNELRDLLPPLSPEEFKSLDENIKNNGCIDPIVTWNGYIIDGHNRYNICNKHNIKFQTIELAFNTKEDVMDWMIEIQLGRRNITDSQKAYLRGLQYEREKKKQGGNRGNQYTKMPSGENAHLPNTSQKLAEIHKVDERTIRKDGQFSKAVDKIAEAVGIEAKNKILNKDKIVSKQDVIDIGKSIEENKIDIKELKKELIDSKDKKVNIKKNKEIHQKEETKIELNKDNNINKINDNLKELENIKTNSDKSIKEIIKDLKTPKYIIPKFDFINELECIYDNLKQFIQDAYDNFFETHDISEIITNEEKDIAVDHFQDLIKQLSNLKNKINNINIKGE